jgi:hypothetical protein
MMKLYREHVLKEQPGPGLVQIESLQSKPVQAKPVEDREEVSSFGD